MKKNLKKAIRFLMVFSAVELGTYLFLSRRTMDSFNFEFFFFVWAFLALITPLVLFFGVESRGNLLAMGRVYDHNNVNTMDQIAKVACFPGRAAPNTLECLRCAVCGQSGALYYCHVVNFMEVRLVA